MCHNIVGWPWMYDIQYIQGAGEVPGSSRIRLLEDRASPDSPLLPPWWYSGPFFGLALGMVEWWIVARGPSSHGYLGCVHTSTISVTSRARPRGTTTLNKKSSPQKIKIKIKVCENVKIKAN